jgi:hypothetical protein
MRDFLLSDLDVFFFTCLMRIFLWMAPDVLIYAGIFIVGSRRAVFSSPDLDLFIFCRFFYCRGLDVLIYAGFFIVGACWSTGGFFIVGISTCCFFTRAGYAWMCCIFYCGISTCSFFYCSVLPPRPSLETDYCTGGLASPSPTMAYCRAATCWTHNRPPTTQLTVALATAGYPCIGAPTQSSVSGHRVGLHSGPMQSDP